MVKSERINGVERAYQFWIKQIKNGMINISLPIHPLDYEKFYTYMRKLMASLPSRKRNVNWFEKKLEKDLTPNLFNSPYVKKCLDKFDTIYGYVRGS